MSEQAARPASDGWAALAAGAIGLALVAAVVLAYGDALAERSLAGRWFQSDGWRVFDDMTDFGASRHRTWVRPLFVPLAMPLALAIDALPGVRSIQAIWIFNMLVATAWGALSCRILLWLGLGPARALLGTCLGLASAAALFWFAVPETYGLGSLSLLLCLALAARSERAPLRDSWLIAANVLCAGTGLPNVATSLALLASQRSLRETLRLAATSAVLLVALWVPQKVIFPQPPAILPSHGVRSDLRFVMGPDQGGPLSSLRSAVIYTAVAPNLEEYRPLASPMGHLLTIQHSGVLASGLGTATLATAWVAALAVGALSWLRSGPRRFTVVLFAMSVSQLGFHSVYGEETFLYALHFAPALVFLACGGLRGSRPVTVFAGLVFVLALACNNLGRLEDAVSRPDLGGVDPRLERLLR